jgi:hypothetical protein
MASSFGPACFQVSTHRSINSRLSIRRISTNGTLSEGSSIDARERKCDVFAGVSAAADRDYDVLLAVDTISHG